MIAGVTIIFGTLAIDAIILRLAVLRSRQSGGKSMTIDYRIRDRLIEDDARRRLVKAEAEWQAADLPEPDSNSVSASGAHSRAVLEGDVTPIIWGVTFTGVGRLDG